MDDKEKLSVSIYHLFAGIKDTLALPTDATLEKTLKFSALLFACSVVSTLTGFYTFISWQGALLCTIVLVSLLWIERRENDALLRMYRDARVSAQKAAQRAKDASARYSGGRRAAGAGAGGQKTSARNKSGNKGKNTGRNGSSSRSAGNNRSAGAHR